MAWTASYQGVLAEVFEFSPQAGKPSPVPLHAHETYQLGLTLSNPGRYWYRGASHMAPPHSLAVIHSGEAHAVQSVRQPDRTATARQFYLLPDYLQAVMPEAVSSSQLPYIHLPVVTDADLTRHFLAAHCTLLAGGPRLAFDELFLGALGILLERYGSVRPPLARHDHAVTVRVREYLHAHHAQNVSLGELAALVELSPFRLIRGFRRATGMSPYAYLVNVRIDRAKTLLAAGLPVAQIALETGFAHQSHFGRHFKRLVGVSPGRYRART